MDQGIEAEDVEETGNGNMVKIHGAYKKAWKDADIAADSMQD